MTRTEREAYKRLEAATEMVVAFMDDVRRLEKRDLFLGTGYGWKLREALKEVKKASERKAYKNLLEIIRDLLDVIQHWDNCADRYEDVIGRARGALNTGDQN